MRSLAANSQKSLRHDIIIVIKSHRKYEYINFFNLINSYISIYKVGSYRQKGGCSYQSVGFRSESGVRLKECRVSVKDVQKSLRYDIIITIKGY